MVIVDPNRIDIDEVNWVIIDTDFEIAHSAIMCGKNRKYEYQEKYAQLAEQVAVNLQWVLENLRKKIDFYHDPETMRNGHCRSGPGMLGTWTAHRFPY